MIFALALLVADGSPPERYIDKVQKIAELKVAKIGCRPRDMILSEEAFRLFVSQTKDSAFWAGYGEADAVSLAYTAEQAEKKRVEDAGGDLVKVAGSASAMARYTEYWRATCEQIKRDPFMSKFFVRREDVKQSYPTTQHSDRMCYKDYCPCQGDQSALDKFICDRLEAGLKVEVETMISGRALRAAKQDIDAFK